MALDWHEVSSRITSALNLAGADDIRRAAERLGVREYQIEETIRRQSRLSALKVAAAMVRVHGLDPSWLLTGIYDQATHRLGQQKSAEEVERLLKVMAFGADRPQQYEPIAAR